MHLFSRVGILFHNVLESEKDSIKEEDLWKYLSDLISDFREVDKDKQTFK